MSVIEQTPDILEQRAALPPVSVWRLSVEQYEEMVRAGILTEDDPVELLDGWLVPKMPKNPSHVLATELACDVLRNAIPQGWHVDSQEPIRLSTSEPEPDAAVVRGDRREYADRLPTPRDIALVVEVADASLQYDMTFKKAIYAAAGIAAYWVVDLIHRRLEVLSSPSASGGQSEYQQHCVYSPDDVAPVMVDGREVAQVAVSDLLP
jgi:Uma2 family endonuclease